MRIPIYIFGIRMMDGGSTDDETGTAVDPIGADVRADHRFDAMAEVYHSRNRRDVQLAGVFCAAVRAAASATLLLLHAGRLPAAGTGRASGVYCHRRPRRHRHPVLWVFDRLSV